LCLPLWNFVLQKNNIKNQYQKPMAKVNGKSQIQNSKIKDGRWKLLSRVQLHYKIKRLKKLKELKELKKSRNSSNLLPQTQSP